MEITKEFKDRVAQALIEQRENYSGSEAAFAKRYGISPSVFNRIKNGEREKLIADVKWLALGREFGITTSERKWNMARTEVFTIIEEEVLFCKEWSKGMLFVDDCGIGKTYTARYLARTVKNCFYVDASQCKKENILIRALAQAVGVGQMGRIHDIKENTKYYLKMLPHPIIIIDEAGDLEYNAFMTLKEYWNATEGCCGWYLMGAAGLRRKLEKGMQDEKNGFAEMFSRHSDGFSNAVPFERNEKLAFYRKLITDVLSANMVDQARLKTIVNRCLTIDKTGRISGLRRAESLVILNT